jgi:hypothetical protein
MARRPTPEERDERFKVDLPAEDFIGGVLAAGPHEVERYDVRNDATGQSKLVTGTLDDAHAVLAELGAAPMTIGGFVLLPPGGTGVGRLVSNGRGLPQS